MPKPQSWKLTWLKISRFEFWPYWVFYFPFLPYLLFQCLRHWNFAFFTNVNPAIYLSGIVGESKQEILDLIPTRYKPASKHYGAEALLDLNSLANDIATNFSFPVVLKPDVGERGNMVEKISSQQELVAYLKCMQEAFIVQEFITAPLEFGLLFYRIPGTEKFGISSLVQKGFLQVEGDGVLSLKQLLAKQNRALLVWDYLEEHLASTWNRIPTKGEIIFPQPIGNHCKGTMFINANHLITEELEINFKKIVDEIQGINYGRFDLKVDNLDDLYQTKKIKVMELNGITAEPAHVYDPHYKLTQAYRDVYQHFRIIVKIARANARLGHKPASSSELWRLLSQFYSSKS